MWFPDAVGPDLNFDRGQCAGVAAEWGTCRGRRPSPQIVTTDTRGKRGWKLQAVPVSVCGWATVDANLVEDSLERDDIPPTGVPELGYELDDRCALLPVCESIVDPKQANLTRLHLTLGHPNKCDCAASPGARQATPATSTPPVRGWGLTVPAGTNMALARPAARSWRGRVSAPWERSSIPATLHRGTPHPGRTICTIENDWS